MLKNILVLTLLFLSIFSSDAKDSSKLKITCDSLGNILSNFSKDFVKDNIKSDFKTISQIYSQTLELNCDCRLQAMNLLGYQYYNKSDLVNAKKLLLDAEELFKELNLFDQEYILNQNYLGLINILEGNYRNASYHFVRCKKISETIQDTMLLTQSYLQLGLAYLEMGELDKAENYYQKCLDFNAYTDNDEFAGYTYQNLARIYLVKKKTKKALKSIDEAYAIWDKTNSTKGKYFLAPLYADIYKLDGAIDKAIMSLENGLRLSESSGIKINLDQMHMRLGSLYYESGNMEKAANAYEGALKYGIRYNREEETELVNRLIEIHSQNTNMDGLKRTIHSVIESNKRAKELQKLQAAELLDSETHLDNKVLENEQLKESFLYGEVKLQKMTFMIIALSTLLIFFFYMSNAKSRESAKRKLLIDKIETQKNKLIGANKELSNSAETIAFQMKELESKNIELQNFAYVASHDLKAPIRTIISFTKILRKKLPHVDEGIDEILTFIETGGHSMNELVTDLLSYAKMESTIDLHEQNVKTLFASILANITALIDAKQATINIQHTIDTVIVDQVKLKQALMNLISNAIKYSKPDVLPIVDINVEEKEGQYIFIIKDNGLGIAEKAQERIFEMFHRLHANHEIEGTGIGLATCKKVIEMHKGKIWVESKVGIGSTFIFTIPNPNAKVKGVIQAPKQVLENAFS